jgi:hypothetical protein
MYCHTVCVYIYTFEDPQSFFNLNNPGATPGCTLKASWTAFMHACWCSGNRYAHVVKRSKVEQTVSTFLSGCGLHALQRSLRKKWMSEIQVLRVLEVRSPCLLVVMMKLKISRTRTCKHTQALSNDVIEILHIENSIDIIIL